MPRPQLVEAQTGLYAPGSVTWRIASDNALMLGGGRALLLQLAHPLVAAGVGAHSDFLTSPVARLERTMTLTLRMVFGTLPEAREAARAVNRAHERVQGDWNGVAYRAGDPSLLLWVHATLVDSALETYATFVGPLSAGDREAYYRESWVLGRLLGIPRSQFPADYPAFRSYVSAMVTESLEVSPLARRLAGAVLRPPLRGVPRPLFWPHEVITSGLLPPRLREQYGLPWGARREAAYRALVPAFRGAIRAAPAFLRRAAPARAAEKRLSG
jgi:uncharacterized protein (DUF2236 family)